MPTDIPELLPELLLRLVPDEFGDFGELLFTLLLLVLDLSFGLGDRLRERLVLLLVVFVLFVRLELLKNELFCEDAYESRCDLTNCIKSLSTVMAVNDRLILESKAGVSTKRMSSSLPVVNSTIAFRQEYSAESTCKAFSFSTCSWNILI